MRVHFGCDFHMICGSWQLQSMNPFLFLLLWYGISIIMFFFANLNHAVLLRLLLRSVKESMHKHSLYGESGRHAYASKHRWTQGKHGWLKFMDNPKMSFQSITSILTNHLLWNFKFWVDYFHFFYANIIFGDNNKHWNEKKVGKVMG